MTKVNFKAFGIYTDITQENKQQIDIRRTLADIIYKNYDGVVAHDLAFRIYRSDGPMELTDEEKALLQQVAMRATPVFRDSLEDAMKEEETAE